MTQSPPQLVTTDPPSQVIGAQRRWRVSARYPIELGGTSPATCSLVLIADIFQYRTLIGKCELGCGLEWAEIDHVQIIETTFALAHRSTKRRFRRDPVNLDGIVRGDQINDRVEIIELGPSGLVFRKAPFIARGEHVEIVIDDGDCSYRFCAQGVWLKDDGEDYKVGVAFIGMPVRINRVQVSKHEIDFVDKIAAAA